MKKILVVDDSYSWREFHKNALDEIFIEISEDDYQIDLAENARDGYTAVMQNNSSPYNLIISDLQMEDDFVQKYAGEWFIEQVKTFKSYTNTHIIISSGCFNIRQIAESLNVNYVPKRVAVTDINQYKETIIKLIKSL